MQADYQNTVSANPHFHKYWSGMKHAAQDMVYEYSLYKALKNPEACGPEES